MSQICRRRFLVAAGALLATPLADAQLVGKVSRVGVLTVHPLSSLTFPRQFPEALRDLGYVEGQNIAIEWRSANGHHDRLGALAAELVRLKVDVIVAVTNADIKAAKRATAAIPIVMAAAQDPVRAGFVASLARPGANITGRAWFAPETGGKYLEILREVVPTATRVAYVTGTATSSITRGMEASAPNLAVTFRVVQILSADNVAQALSELEHWKPDALIVSAVVSAGLRDTILKFAAQHRLPTMSQTRGMVEAGIMMAYTSDALEGSRRPAYFVHRILQGADPAELPVEFPQKYELIVNLRTARAIGLTVPPSILVRADRVIE